MKRLLALLMILCSSWNIVAADSTIGNLTPAVTVGDTWRVPWENPAVLDYFITFANLTNQILAGMASQAYANSITNSFGSLIAAWQNGNIPLLNGVNFFLNNNEFAAGAQFDSTVTVQGNLLDGGTLNVGSTGSVSPTNQFEVHAAGGMFNLGTNGVLYLNGLQIGSGGTNVTIINNPVYFTTNIIVGGGTTSTNLYVYDILGALRLQVDTNGTKFFGNAGPTTISNLNVLSLFTIDGTNFYDWLAGANLWTDTGATIQPKERYKPVQADGGFIVGSNAVSLQGPWPGYALGNFNDTSIGESPAYGIFTGSGTASYASTFSIDGYTNNLSFLMDAGNGYRTTIVNDQYGGSSLVFSLGYVDMVTLAPDSATDENYVFDTVARGGSGILFTVRNGGTNLFSVSADGTITGAGIGGGVTQSQLQGSTNTATLHAQGLALTSEVVTNNDTRPTVLDNTLQVNGSVGANVFYGDGSGLSNVPPSLASSVAASNILVGAAGGQLPVGGLYDITTNEAGYLLVSSGGSRHRTFNGGSLTNLTEAINDTNDLSTVLKARMDSGTNDLSTVLKARMDAGTNDINTALVAKIQASTNLPPVLTNAISQALYTPYQITPTSTSGGPATNVLIDPVNGNYQYVVSGTNYYISCAAPVLTSGATVRLDLWLSNTCALTINAAYLESNAVPVFTYSTSNINVLLFDHPYPCGKSTNYWNIFQLSN